MPIAIDPKETRDYVLKCDRALPDGDKGKTVFKLGILTAREYASLQDGVVTVSGGENRETRVKSGSLDLETLVKGLKGWENFYDKAGNPVEFNGKALERDLVKLSPAHRSELAEAIRECSEPSEETVKN